MHGDSLLMLTTKVVSNKKPPHLSDSESGGSTSLNFYETRLEEIKQSYENQLNEQKKQVEYFKNLYEEEKSERIRANAQYQTYLLGTAEDNKRHWWQFWNKTNKERDN